MVLLIPPRQDKHGGAEVPETVVTTVVDRVEVVPGPVTVVVDGAAEDIPSP